MKPPLDWKQITLGELLTKKQARRVVSILKRETDTVERTRRVGEYLATIKEELDKKGVDDAFLTYYLEYLVLTHKV